MNPSGGLVTAMALPLVAMLGAWPCYSSPPSSFLSGLLTASFAQVRNEVTIHQSMYHTSQQLAQRR